MSRNDDESHLARQIQNKPYTEEVLPDGTIARRYPDGSLRDDKGRMIEQLPNSGIQSSEQAREMAITRNEKAREKAIEGMIRGVEESGINLNHRTGSEAWMHIIAHTVKTYLKSTNIRGMGETLTKLGTATGFLDPHDEAPPLPNGIYITGELAAVLIDIAVKAGKTSAPRGTSKEEIIDVETT